LSNAFSNQKHENVKKDYNRAEVRLSIVIPEIQHLIKELNLNDVTFLDDLLAQVTKIDKIKA